jgi:hypothetical protein
MTLALDTSVMAVVRIGSAGCGFRRFVRCGDAPDGRQ